MKTILVLIIGLNISTQLIAACAIDPDIIAARYVIQNTEADNSFESKVMIFWRMKDQVAYQYVDSQVTEVWNLVRNGMVRPVRYFEQFKRGIEYQPMEINGGDGEADWRAKSQILGGDFFSQLKLVDSTDANCNALAHYQSQVKNELQNNKEQNKKVQLDEKKINLSWLTHYQIPNKLSIQVADSLVVWELQSMILNKQKVMDFFSKRDGYYLTDYADIGDNESDPFLLKMINLGFVSHPLSIDNRNQQPNQQPPLTHHHSH